MLFILRETGSERNELWFACILFVNYKSIVYKTINFIGHVTCLTYSFKIRLNNKDKKAPRVSLGQGLFMNYRRRDNISSNG